MSKKKKKPTKAKKKTPTKAVEKKPEKEPKKKKKHKGLIIFAVIFAILIVFPVTFIFGAFYDTSHKNNLPTSELSYQNLVSTMISDGMNNVSKENKLSLHLNEEMLDGVMLYACKQLSQEKYIPSMYCDINGNDYNFYVELQASFFKTRVTITTSMEKADEGDPENERLVFKIKQLKLGRLIIPVNWISGIVGNFVTDEMIETAFRKTGINFKCSFADMQLIYYRKQFLTDIQALLVEFAGNNQYINMFLDIFSTNSEKILDVNFNGQIDASFDLSHLMNTEYGGVSNHYFDFNGEQNKLEEYTSKITDWLNQGYFDESTATPVFTYLLRGKESDGTVLSTISNLDETFKTTIFLEYLKGLQSDVTSIEDYKGGIIFNKENKQFSDYCDSDAKKIGDVIADENAVTRWISDHDEDLPVVSLRKENLNKYLASIGSAVGNTTLITSYNNKSWNVDFIAVDNLYVDFISNNGENKLCLFLGVNINGCPTTVVIPTSVSVVKDTVNNKISLHLDIDKDDEGNCNIFYGSIQFPKDTQSILFNKMIDLIQNEVFKFNRDAKRFEISLDTFVEGFSEVAKGVIINFLSDEYAFDNESITFKLHYSD